jgi:peptidoglycan/LPS O-acetylase OafA/YrhL
MYSQFVSFLNKPLSPSNLNHGYSQHIEQYRGLCALLVVINHGTVHEDLLLDNFKWPNYVAYFGAPFLSVLIFFCISGYVIGITNDKVTLDVKGYLKKRAIRLYPIYIVTILLSILVVWNFPVFEVLGNLFFLQNATPYFHFKIPVFVNYSSWTLNYEALYYLLFIGLFFLQPKMWKLLSGMLLLSILLINSSPSILFFVNYLNLYYFWLLGLIIGWSIFKSEPPKDRSIPVLSLLFLHLCLNHLDLGVIILHIIGMHSETNISVLFDIPFCLMIMCILTAKDNAFLRFNKILCYLLPSVVFVYLILNHRIFEDVRWIMCLIYWLLSLSLYFEKRISAYLLDKLTYIGKISYALYLVHVPIAKLIKKTIFISDQRTEIIVKYVLWIVITFALSILLERYFQPAVKRLILMKKSKPIPRPVT